MSEAAIRPAVSDADLAAVRAMIMDYAAGFGFGLCFDGLEAELATFPGAYGQPDGALLVADVAGAPAGCVALRRLEPGIGEMKRLYVRPAIRGHGLGRRLCAAILDQARTLGYRSVRLDTRPDMAAAQALYRALGFSTIPAYYADPEEGVAFFEKTLDTGNRAA